MWAEEEVPTNEMRRTARGKPNKNIGGGINSEILQQRLEGPEDCLAAKENGRVKNDSNAFSGGGEWRETGTLLISTAQCGKGGAGGQIGEKIIIYALSIFCLQR